MDFKVSMTGRLICNLGHNKMEQQTTIPPKSRTKPREGQKSAVFSSLILGREGGGGGRGLGFPFIFSNFAVLDRIKWKRNPILFPTPKARMKPRKGQKRAIFQSLILGGGSRVSIYFVQEGGSRREKVEVVFGLGQMGQLFRSYKQYKGKISTVLEV